eukprot:639219-Rhodomonas_salina.1
MIPPSQAGLTQSRLIMITLAGCRGDSLRLAGCRSLSSECGKPRLTGSRCQSDCRQRLTVTAASLSGMVAAAGTAASDHHDDGRRR